MERHARQYLYQSTDICIQPVAGDRKIEPIKYEESKREYSEKHGDHSTRCCRFFFSVLQQQINLQIAQFNLANNDTIYKIEQGRYNIGTTSEDKLLQIELQLLRSRQDGTGKAWFSNSQLAIANFYWFAQWRAVWVGDAWCCSPIYGFRRGGNIARERNALCFCCLSTKKSKWSLLWLRQRPALVSLSMTGLRFWIILAHR